MRPGDARELSVHREDHALRSRAHPRTRRAGPDYHQYVEGHLGRYQTSKTADDYKQAGERYRTFEDWERDDLINNLATDLKQCPEQIQLRMVWHFWHCDPDYGARVAKGAGIDLEKAKALRPLGAGPRRGTIAQPDLHGWRARRGCSASQGGPTAQERWLRTRYAPPVAEVLRSFALRFIDTSWQGAPLNGTVHLYDE